MVAQIEHASMACTKNYTQYKRIPPGLNPLNFKRAKGSRELLVLE